MDLLGNMIPQGVQQWGHARWIELDKLAQLVQQALQQRSLHPAKGVSLAMLGTTLLAALAVNVLLISTTKRGRQLVCMTIETVLASAATVLLLCIVAGLPVGALYLIFKAFAYMVRTVTEAPALSELFTRLQGD